MACFYPRVYRGAWVTELKPEDTELRRIYNG